MSDESILTKVVAEVRLAVAEGRLSRTMVEKAIADISDIQIYLHDKFPELKNTTALTDTSGGTPASLAEALLWKLGKWKVYKKFAADYMAESPSPTRTGVVLYAFLKHLKESEEPIYDQHALRGLWAVCSNLTESEQAICKSVLVDGEGQWKKAGSGSDTIECYELFRRHVKALTSGSDSPSLKELDRLLMPLGQALKRAATPYEKFCQVCGFCHSLQVPPRNLRPPRP